VESTMRAMESEMRCNATYDPVEKRWKAGQFRGLIIESVSLPVANDDKGSPIKRMSIFAIGVQEQIQLCLA